MSKELAERAQAQLEKNKKDNLTRNPDPLATIWRTMAYCGHCGYRMSTAPGMPGEGRKYRCRSRPAVEGLPVDCPGGKFTMNATTLDASGWADVRAWLRDEDNVRRLLAEWEQEENSVENSAAARLEAVAANIRKLRGNMDSLADTIAQTANKESRRVLQEKLDNYAERVVKEEAKRERLMTDASDAATHAQDARDIREWVSAVASHADTFTRAEQVTALHALGAQVTIWRADHVHEDGWPQRYKIALHFTGFTGQPVTLPPAHSESDHK